VDDEEDIQWDPRIGPPKPPADEEAFTRELLEQERARRLAQQARRFEQLREMLL